MTDNDDLHKFFDLDERREEARLNLGADIYIEVEAKEPGSSKPGKVLSCDAVDLSANGLQVLVDDPLTSGAIHTMIVELDADRGMFRLSAEVRWVKPHSEGYLTGLSLYESDGTEIIDWKLMVARYLN